MNTHTDTHQATVCRSVYESVCVYVWGCTLVGEHSLLHAHTQTQNVYIIKPCSVLTSAVWRGASSTTISVSDHDFYLLNVGKVGYIMNVSERQQKKKKKGFWERTEAKGSVKGQTAPLQVHSECRSRGERSKWLSNNTRVTRQARKQGRQSYC